MTQQIRLVEEGKIQNPHPTRREINRMVGPMADNLIGQAIEKGLVTIKISPGVKDVSTEITVSAVFVKPGRADNAVDE